VSPDQVLVRPLFEGPIDIIGDVHGEDQALATLLDRLGYRADGTHPQRRRLVFLGDLVDRGPDSPAVIRRVRDLVQRGRAQCLLGNHELNLLLERVKDHNAWFFGHQPTSEEEGGPQTAAPAGFREEALRFFSSLPIALERIGLRVVHASWHPVMVERARFAHDVCHLYRQETAACQRRVAEQGLTDPVDRDLTEQNENAVRVLTSGLEEAAPAGYFLNGKWRLLERQDWWHHYYDLSWCVIGHYSRCRLPWESSAGDRMTGSTDPADPRQYGPLGASRVLCIDYSAGYRWKERRTVGNQGPFLTRLAALRVPEMTLHFDTDAPVQSVPPTPR
jgi:hypothetical protein